MPSAKATSRSISTGLDVGTDTGIQSDQPPFVDDEEALSQAKLTGDGFSHPLRNPTGY